MEYKHMREMMGTDIEISVIGEDPHIEERIGSIFDFFVSFEQEFSRFLPHSSVSMLNEYLKWDVSSRFLELMRLSEEYHIKTRGYFNPLTDISKLGYSKDFMKSEFVKSDRISDMDFNGISIDGTTIILKPNQRLDFGGIGKGFAVDLASGILKAYGYDDFFINAGGDIYASGKNQDRQPWVIGIENPADRSLLGTLQLSNQAVTTSGKYKRNWMIDGRRYHHIMDPKTGGNSFDIASVTLISDKTSKADVFTKAVFNMPIGESMAFMESNDISGFVIMDDGRIMASKDMDRYHLEIYGQIIT